MSEKAPAVDLSVSGETVVETLQSATPILKAQEDVSSVTVTIESDATHVSLSADGPRADDAISGVLSGIDLDAIPPSSVRIVAHTDEGDPGGDFIPPEDPQPGDRIGPWTSAESDIKPPLEGTRRREVLEILSDYPDGLTSPEVTTQIGGSDPDPIAGDLTNLYFNSGMVERARAQPRTGGRLFVYRLSSHGRAVVGE